MAVPFHGHEDEPPRDAPPTIDAPVTAASIEGLRARLVGARADRGACPPFADLERDLLPTREPRCGREQRRSHLDRCPLCAHRVSAWKTSWQGRAAFLTTLARIQGGRLARGAGRALSAVPGLVPHRKVDAPKGISLVVPDVDAPTSAGPTPASSVPPGAGLTRAALPPPSRSATRNEPRPARPPRGSRRAPVEKLPPLLVFEAPPPGVTPRALIDAVAARGGAVVTVGSVEEVFTDPDFGSVRAIVLGRSRPLAEWAAAIQSVQRRAPGRVVLAIAPVPSFGPLALSWARDPAVLMPPVGENAWDPALQRAGWLSPA